MTAPAPLLVQKYGGTSVATPERIRAVAQRIHRERARGTRLIVVVSAMGHTTDELVALAHRVAERPSRREMDMLLTAGERISMALLSMCLTDIGAEAISFTGSQVGIITDGSHTDARIVDVRGQRLLDELARGRIVIVAGFQGVSLAKEVTTLGRGGSDTTAVALAAAFHADACEILTDVDGVMSAHPSVVPDARLRRALSFEEMIEMAYLGAQVLHPRAAEMALRYGVRIHVRSSFHEEPGTMVVDDTTRSALESDEIAGITHEENVALLLVDGPGGTAARALGALAEVGVVPRIVAQTPRPDGGESLGAIVSQDAAESAAVRLSACAGLAVSVRRDLALVSAVGKSVLADGPLLTRAYGCLAEAGVPVFLTSTSAITASMAVPRDRAGEAVRALHAALIDAAARTT